MSKIDAWIADKSVVMRVRRPETHTTCKATAYDVSTNADDVTKAARLERCQVEEMACV